LSAGSTSSTAATTLIKTATVRPATAVDADVVFGLLRELRSSYVPDRAAFDETFAAAVAEGSDDIVLVSTDEDERVTGYALTTITRLFYTNGPSAQLQELLVEESSRGQRIGTALVTATEDACRASGVRQLTVASQRAAGYYEGLGYLSTADFLKRTFD